MKKRSWLMLALAFGVIVSDVRAQESPSPKFSGHMFGDYYWVADDHRSDLKGRNGFWFRRIYVTLDESLAESWAVRFRLEMNSPGDFRSSASLTPFVKDAYLRWRGGRHEVYLGLSPTPTWDNTVEPIWGYRSVEKTPLDLQRMGSSRELGVALKGSFDAAQRFRYHLMVGNGLGTAGADVDKGKKGLLSLGWYPSPAWVLEVYADYEDRPGPTDWWTLQGFVAYRTARFRAGLLYAHQTRRGTPARVRLDVGSVFIVVRLTDGVALLGRYDRMFRPNPEADRIAYIPMDPTARSHLVVTGVDVSLHRQVHLIPNVEYVAYDAPAGRPRPGSDFFLRTTLFFEF